MDLRTRNSRDTPPGTGAQGKKSPFDRTVAIWYSKPCNRNEEEIAHMDGDDGNDDTAHMCRKRE